MSVQHLCILHRGTMTALCESTLMDYVDDPSLG